MCNWHSNIFVNYGSIVTCLVSKEALVKRMDEQGIRTFSALSEMAGIHRNSLRPYLAGEASPFSSVVVRVAEVLKCSPLTFVQDGNWSREENVEYRKIVTLLSEIHDDRGELAFVFFGSRANESQKRYSDWDIGVTAGKAALQTTDYLILLEQLKELEERDFARSIDFLNFDQAPASFFREMEGQPKLIVGDEKSYQFLLGKIEGIRDAKT